MTKKKKTNLLFFLENKDFLSLHSIVGVPFHQFGLFSMPAQRQFEGNRFIFGTGRSFTTGITDRQPVGQTDIVNPFRI